MDDRHLTATERAAVGARPETVDRELAACARSVSAIARTLRGAVRFIDPPDEKSPPLQVDPPSDGVLPRLQRLLQEIAEIEYDCKRLTAMLPLPEAEEFCEA